MSDTSVALPGLRFEPKVFSDEELADLNQTFERWPAHNIIKWAADSFGPYLSLAASMADALLIDLSVKVDPAIEVIDEWASPRRGSKSCDCANRWT